MTVYAHCTDCSDKHDLGDRISVPGTTKCPECGSQSYWSEPIITESSESVTKEIDPDALVTIDGVGETVAMSIATQYSTVESLQQADEEDLTQIDYVGPTVAKRVISAIA